MPVALSSKIVEESSSHSLRFCIGPTMPVCAICRLAKPGVQLCADDLLCSECLQDNERKLAELNNQNSTSLAVASESMTTPAELTSKTRAAKTRQSKAKSQPSENTTTTNTFSDANAI